MNAGKNGAEGSEKKHIHVNEPIVAEPHEHGHGHVHSHAQTQVVIHRLSRAIGHLESVRNMVKEGRDCSEVLIQLSAVRGSLGAISRVILKDHMEHCIVDAVEHGDQESLEALNRAIDKIL